MRRSNPRQFVVAAARIDSAAALFRSAEGAARSEADARLARAKAAETRPASPPVAVSPPPAAVPPPAPPAAPAEVPRQPADNEATAKEAISRSARPVHDGARTSGHGRPEGGVAGAERGAAVRNPERVRQRPVDSTRSLPRRASRWPGTTATVNGVRRYTVQTRDGQQLHRDTATTIHLRRAGSAWVIETIRFEQPR